MEEFLLEVIDKCSVEDLMRGYVHDINSNTFICLYCGAIYEDGIIYQNKEKIYTAKKAAEIHIKLKHGGAFEYLLSLDKKYTGISERQKEIFKVFFDNVDNQDAANKLDTSPSTIRSYKFKSHIKMRQAKIYLAIGNLLENQISKKKRGELSISDLAIEKKNKNVDKSQKDEEKKYKGFDLNFINPFVKNGKPGMK